jgi:hypothetical protein
MTRLRASPPSQTLWIEGSEEREQPLQSARISLLSSFFSLELELAPRAGEKIRNLSETQAKSNGLLGKESSVVSVQFLWHATNAANSHRQSFYESFTCSAQKDR